MQDNIVENNPICQRCNQSFVCNAKNIAECGCSKIELSFQETQWITKKYSNCVCNSCLLHLKIEFLKLK